MVSGIVQQAGTAINNLVSNINNVKFNDDFIITKILGLLRYIFGDVFYLLFVTSLEIGAGFILWKLMKIVVNTISGLIPGLKGKVKIE
jgi:hypothetical protein